MTLNVVQFPTPDYKDAVKALRNIADEIEAGAYGDVSTAAIALFGDKLEVFGAGSDSEAPTVALLFSAAAARFAREIEEYGR
jgi:hypothetical protein